MRRAIGENPRSRARGRTPAVPPATAGRRRLIVRIQMRRPHQAFVPDRPCVRPRQVGGIRRARPLALHECGDRPYEPPRHRQNASAEQIWRAKS